LVYNGFSSIVPSLTCQIFLCLFVRNLAPHAPIAVLKRMNLLKANVEIKGMTDIYSIGKFLAHFLPQRYYFLPIPASFRPFISALSPQLP